jgi:hypothetical protein
MLGNACRIQEFSRQLTLLQGKGESGMIAFQEERDVFQGAPRRRRAWGCISSGIEFDEDDELNLQMVQSGPRVLRVAVFGT